MSNIIRSHKNNALRFSCIAALFFALLSLPFHTLSGQTTKSIPISIDWYEMAGNQHLPTFIGANNSAQYPGIPVWHYQFELSGPTRISASLSNVERESISLQPNENRPMPQEILPEGHTYIQGNKYYGVVTLPAIVRRQGKAEKLLKGTLNIRLTPDKSFDHAIYRGDPKTTSELASGQVYKISVSSYGVHVIDDALLRELGINTNGLDPRNIRILGHPGGALPERISSERVDDLEELSIWVEGESDGKWDSGDRILFYAEGPDRIALNKDKILYIYENNIYDDKSYYYIKIDTKPGKRIRTISPVISPEYTSKSYLNLQHYEEDKTNLLGQSRSHEGSGQLWVGDEFTNVRTREYSDKFSTLHLDPSEKATVNMRFVARNSEYNKVSIEIDQQLLERNISSINITSVESLYARIANITGTANLSNIKVIVNYPLSPNVSSGWLDYININHKKKYNYANENQLRIYDPASLDYNSVRYTFEETPSGFTVWDITDPMHPAHLSVQRNGTNSTISYQNNKAPWQHLAFNTAAGLLIPESAGAVAQQNLHGLKDIDEIIVYYDATAEAAQKLAKHREQEDGMTIALAHIHQIYNEFSAGKQDPTAIRDFVRTVYKHSKALKYVLLFGDGSYDYRGIRKNLPKESFIPVYETKESLNPITAFPSDDYFGMISDDEGYDLRGLLDVSIGRIPAHDSEDAMRFVDRIITYETDPATFQDWKNRFLGAADDEDSNRYFYDIENLSKIISSQNPNYNIDKIYLDAYEQLVTSGGQRYPEVTRAINQSIFKGVFMFTYLGHGGPTGLAQERILQINDILQWNNGVKTPIFLTATCSFTPFDDPEFVSVGEQTILHPSGGVSALLSTVRAVYAGSNYQMTSFMIRELTNDFNGKRPKLGDLFMRSKNNNGGNAVNTQKFLIFGDPAMKVMVPTFDVVTTKINNQSVQDFRDTLHALDKVALEGVIKDHNGNIVTDFNGKLYVTLFDKPTTLRTKGNDEESSIASFTLQKNILYKGLVSIKDGRFSVSFILPKEINFKIGNGKISYYATDEKEREAHGYKIDIPIGGGGSGNFTDDTPPQIQLFLNDLQFVNGGIAGTNPILLATLKDDYGINFSGSSIGHDITAQLDNSDARFVLNEHFEPTLDNSKEGQIKYPLTNLDPGEHHIKVTAWDIANNVSEASLDFVVIDQDNPTLKHVLNYPNPFTTHTSFQFEHNQADSEMEVMIQIFTANGTLVKTIQQTALGVGFRVGNIDWDGTDDFGNKLARGVYLYKIYVTVHVAGDTTTRVESPLSKLVILK